MCRLVDVVYICNKCKEPTGGTEQKIDWKCPVAKRKKIGKCPDDGCSGREQKQETHWTSCKECVIKTFVKTGDE